MNSGCAATISSSFSADSTAPAIVAPASSADAMAGATVGKRVGTIVAIAALYIVAAGLGRLLAFSPGYASPIWPAAGIALTALLMSGRHGWFGVWLGAWVVHLSMDFSATGALLAGFSASGAALQASLGARVARRFRRTRTSRDWDRDLSRLLLLAGPAACLVSASIGALALAGFGRLAVADIPGEWLVWWAGDTLGVLLFAPVALLAWPGPRPAWAEGWSKTRTLLPLLVTAMLLTAGNLGLVRLEDNRARAAAEESMEEVHDLRFLPLAGAIEPLRGVERFFAARDDVTPEEFAVYTELARRQPALLAVDWAPRVSRAERAAFEALASDGIDTNYPILEIGGDGHLWLAGDRADYFPILFSEPGAGGRGIWGLDHGFDATRREAMAYAVGTRTIAVAAAVPLLRTERQALLVFQPVHRSDGRAGQDLQQDGYEALRGFVVGVFDVERLFVPLAYAAQAHGLTFRVSDVTPGQPRRVLRDTLAAGATPRWKKEIEFGGRTWRLEMQSAALGWRSGSSVEARLYSGISVLAALLVAFVALSTAGRNALIEAEVTERTAALGRELNARLAAEKALQEREEDLRITIHSIGVGLIATDGQGRITRFNAVAERLTGWNAAQVLGLPVEDVFRIIDSDTREAAPDPVAAVLRTGEIHSPAPRVVLLARDGGECPVSESAAPIRDAAGDVRGVVLVFRDVSRERAAERALLLDITGRKKAEQQFDRFFHLSLDLLCIADTAGSFRRVNPAFSQTLGWSDEELYARPFLDLIHPDDLPETLSQLDRLAGDERMLGFENRYRCKDGSWRWFEWKAVPQPDGLIFATARDTTAQHEAADKLERLNADLQARVEERSAALAALNARQEELRAVLDNLLDCVVTIDARGIVQRVNPAVETVLGYKPEEVVGRNVSLLMPHDHRVRHDGYISSYLRTGEAQIIGNTREVEGLHKLGHRVALELAITEFAVGGERYFVGTLRDIRERKALITQLTSAWAGAEHASLAKSAFLATMSHEIRTPMNGVVGLIDVLVNTELTERQADLAQTIRESAGTLLGIIDDILDFSKIEAGKLDLARQPVPVADLVESVGSALLPVALRREVDLALFIAPDVPERVLSDDLRLRQVLYNLAGNAIKFSGGRAEKRGRVSVRVSIVEREPLWLAIRVADNGIGMSAETLREIFEPFSQAEASTTRRYGGTGLGLAICKRLVDLMQGEIAVESAPGVGSTFTITLPFDVPTEQPRRLQPDLSGLDCILVDGAEFNVRDLGTYLEDAGATVHIASDRGAVARLAADISQPAVLIRDVGFGSAEGEAFFNELQGLRHLLITRGRRRRARVAESNAVTLDGNALRRHAFLRAVAVAAGRASPEIVYKGDVEPIGPREPLLPTVAEAREQRRLILVADDDEINQKVILQQLGLLGYAAEVAGNGAEALRLWRGGQYALLLTDLHMPEMDGYMLAAAIRGEEGGQRRMPILAVTANALRGEATRAVEAGMDDYLTKPVRLQVLKDAMEKWLPDAGTRSPFPGPAEASSSEPRAPAVKAEVLEALVGDDPLTVREFLVEYLGVARQRAAELRAAFEEDDPQRVGEIAHKLKSASRSVGALALGDLCAELENGGRARDRAAVALWMGRFQAHLSAVETDIAARTDAPTRQDSAEAHDENSRGR